MYLTGCAGNIAAGKYHDRPRRSTVLRDRVYQAMVAAWKATVCQPVQGWEWRVVPVRLPTPVSKVLRERTKPHGSRKPQGIQGPPGNAAFQLSWLERIHRPIELTCLDFGKAVVVHLPGEPFIQYQLYAQELQGCLCLRRWLWRWRDRIHSHGQGLFRGRLRNRSGFGRSGERAPSSRRSGRTAAGERCLKPSGLPIKLPIPRSLQSRTEIRITRRKTPEIMSPSTNPPFADCRSEISDSGNLRILEGPRGRCIAAICNLQSAICNRRVLALLGYPLILLVAFRWAHSTGEFLVLGLGPALLLDRYLLRLLPWTYPLRWTKELILRGAYVGLGGRLFPGPCRHDPRKRRSLWGWPSAWPPSFSSASSAWGREEGSRW